MASRSPAPHGITTEVADHVYLVSGHNTNWVLVADGDDLTLVDAGYPADLANVERSVHELGRHPRDIRAILVTHAHVDHVGTVPNLVQKYDIPVFMTPAEVPHARREYLQQAT